MTPMTLEEEADFRSRLGPITQLLPEAGRLLATLDAERVAHAEAVKKHLVTVVVRDSYESERDAAKRALDNARAELKLAYDDCHDGGCRACARCCDDYKRALDDALEQLRQEEHLRTTTLRALIELQSALSVCPGFKGVATDRVWEALADTNALTAYHPKKDAGKTP